RYLPVAWEDTRLLSGYPAESVVIARKSKDSWYISGLNGTENSKSFRVNLEFIKDSIQLIQLFSDTTDGKQIKIENSAFDTKELNIECQPRGGFVVWVKLRK
ncbi:MAG: glycoside hydrolase family 97 C-terminal domain-containing protein, partial [Phocaeicola vulgatus]|nr:glycoside hydrolase family 97 C-terminal domain-containing protein [Phocaeicola vulgatus]